MPIPVVQLEFDNSEVITIHCPSCGTVAITHEENPQLCQHVEFVYFPAGDMEYFREDLEVTVSEWREKAEEEGEDFHLAEALCERRADPTSFIFEISWEGMPEMLWVGFQLTASGEGGESEDEGESSGTVHQPV
jgi:hypothetical protein